MRDDVLCTKVKNHGSNVASEGDCCNQSENSREKLYGSFNTSVILSKMVRKSFANVNKSALISAHLMCSPAESYAANVIKRNACTFQPFRMW